MPPLLHSVKSIFLLLQVFLTSFYISNSSGGTYGQVDSVLRRFPWSYRTINKLFHFSSVERLITCCSGFANWWWSFLFWNCIPSTILDVRGPGSFPPFHKIHTSITVCGYLVKFTIPGHLVCSSKVFDVLPLIYNSATSQFALIHSSLKFCNFIHLCSHLDWSVIFALALSFSFLSKVIVLTDPLLPSSGFWIRRFIFPSHLSFAFSYFLGSKDKNYYRKSFPFSFLQWDPILSENLLWPICLRVAPTHQHSSLVSWVRQAVIKRSISWFLWVVIFQIQCLKQWRKF